MCIVGPTGCGKTAAVYACANELCYNIIEVNAGDTNGRGRKQILSQFGEATTSHRISVPVVKKPVVDLSKTGMDSLFGNRKKTKGQKKGRSTRKRKSTEKSRARRQGRKLPKHQRLKQILCFRKILLKPKTP